MVKKSTNDIVPCETAHPSNCFEGLVIFLVQVGPYQIPQAALEARVSMSYKTQSSHPQAHKLEVC